MHNVTHILLWRHCDSKSFTVVLVDIFQLYLTLRFVRQRRLTLDTI